MYKTTKLNFPVQRKKTGPDSDSVGCPTPNYRGANEESKGIDGHQMTLKSPFSVSAVTMLLYSVCCLGFKTIFNL